VLVMNKLRLASMYVVLDILSPDNVTEQGCAHGTRKINLGVQNSKYKNSEGKN